MLPAPLARRAAVAGLLAALALPAGAQAAKLDQPLKPCYVSAGNQREPIRVLASGFTPGAIVDVVVDGVPFTNEEVRANGLGIVDGEVLAPPQATGERPFTLTVTERDLTGNTVSTTSRVTALAVRHPAGAGAPLAARDVLRPRLHRRRPGVGPLRLRRRPAPARAPRRPARPVRHLPGAPPPDAHQAPAHGHVDAAGRPAALLRADAGHQRLPDQHHGHAHAALAVAAHVLSRFRQPIRR